MFIGDEYAVYFLVTGALPHPLRTQRLLVVPGAMERIRRSPQRAAAGAALGKGQLYQRLKALKPEAIESIMNPDPNAARVLGYEDLAAGMIEAADEATVRGIALPPISQQYIAAARLYQAPIWVGNDGNIPRWARLGIEFSGVRWHEIGELDERLRRAPPPSPGTQRMLFD